MTKQTFPRKLLRASSADRYSFFKNQIIQHSQHIEAFTQVCSEINNGEPGTLIFVIGPTGVGKTTLRHTVANWLWDSNHEAMMSDPGRLSHVSLTLKLVKSKYVFDWEQFYYDLAQELLEPLPDRKVLRSDSLTRLSYVLNTTNTQRTRALAASLDNAVKYRRPQVALIDEAQYFRYVASGRNIFSQMESVKSFAQETGLTLVLFGTYDTLDLLDLSGQLGRRGHSRVHYRRYQLTDISNDGQKIPLFLQALKTFQCYLPLRLTPDLLKESEYFYTYSVGCIGILKDWLSRSLKTAMADEEQKPFMEYVRQKALATSSLEQMAADIASGEGRLNRSGHELARIRGLLGLGSQKPKPEGGKFLGPKQGSPATVGVRKPTRDPVGKL